MTKKLLITAVSKYDWQDEKIKYSVCDGFIKPIADQARAYGWEVEYRGVVPGEDLRGYQKVMAIVSGMTNFRATWLFGVLWALASREDAVLLCNDSRFPNAKKEAASLLKKKEGIFQIDWFHQKEAARKVYPDLQRVLATLASGSWPWKTVVGAFKQATPEGFKLNSDTNLITLDPTSYWLPFYQKNTPQGAAPLRRWLHATMVKRAAGLDLKKRTWPVTSIGQQLPGDNVKSHPFMSEQDLLKMVAVHWGITAFKYVHAGSLWWRPRYLMAAVAGRVLQASFDEAMALDDAYLEAADWEHVESLDDQKLRGLAYRQSRRLLEELSAPTKVFQSQLDDLLWSR